MVSDDMRLFFWSVGPVMRVLTEIRFVPRSLTAEEQSVEPLEGIFPERCIHSCFCFLFLAGSVRRRLADRSYQKLLQLPDQPVPAAIKESTKDSLVQVNVVLMSRSTNLES